MEIIYWTYKGNEKLCFFSQTPLQRQVEVTKQPTGHKNLATEILQDSTSDRLPITPQPFLTLSL
jgi:hypothetical protein